MKGECDIVIGFIGRKKMSFLRDCCKKLSEVQKFSSYCLHSVQRREYSGNPFNAVLGVHRSDPRYIRVDGYNAVCWEPQDTHVIMSSAF